MNMISATQQELRAAHSRIRKLEGALHKCAGVLEKELTAYRGATVAEVAKALKRANSVLSAEFQYAP